jgi:molybdopterin/thiamine biosynthesis adenylyltransferase
MISTVKHAEYFDPMKVEEPIHIIGLGAIGSHICEMLVRLGLEKFYLYDLDRVEAKNVANQIYFDDLVGMLKTEATAAHMAMINPDISGQLFHKGWDGHALAGYVFLCVDNIDLRRRIVEENQYNSKIKAMFDFRMRLSDAQHYAADWSDKKNVKDFLATMQFTHEEAAAATPVSACGTTLSIIPTIKMITAAGIANFINFVKGQPLKKMILLDAFDFSLDAM